MAPFGSTETVGRGRDRVRARILTELHVGKLRPGDRVPSVRRLADLAGLNYKTVHRAYAALADEGVLEVRRGSGTFIRERQAGPVASDPGSGELVSALNRCRAEAMRVGLRPRAFATFVAFALGDGLRGLPVVVTECNREQIEIIGRQLRASLGVATEEYSIAELHAYRERALGGAEVVVTTDCHWTEVARIVEPLGLPVYPVALDGEFPSRVAQLASRGETLLVVRDRAFEAAFLRLLRQLRVPDERLRRIRFAEPREAPGALSHLGSEATVWVSPTVDGSVRALPPHARVRTWPWWTVDPASLDRLRASLALDATLRHGSAGDRYTGPPESEAPCREELLRQAWRRPSSP